MYVLSYMYLCIYFDFDIEKKESESDQPSTFLYNKATTEPTSRNTEQRNYYMTNLQYFLTTKLLHDQSSTFLYSKITPCVGCKPVGTNDLPCGDVLFNSFM